MEKCYLKMVSSWSSKCMRWGLHVWLIRRKERKVVANAYRHHQGMLIYIYCRNIYAEMFACTPVRPYHALTRPYLIPYAEIRYRTTFIFSVPLTISSIVINTKMMDRRKNNLETNHTNISDQEWLALHPSISPLLNSFTKKNHLFPRDQHWHHELPGPYINVLVGMHSSSHQNPFQFHTSSYIPAWLHIYFVILSSATYSPFLSS